MIKLAVAGIVFALASSQVASAASAFVRAAKGQPKFVQNGIPVSVRAGDLVPDSVTIKTGPSDSVDLVFDGNGRVLSIGANSEVKVDVTGRNVKLEKGELLGSFRQKDKSLPDVTVQTPRGIATVNRGDFAINTADSQVSVVSGSLNYQSATANSTATTVPAGRVVIDSKGPQITPMTMEQNGTLLSQLDLMASGGSKIAKSFRAAATYTPPAPNTCSPEPNPGPGTGTPGYWKTHPEAWPSSTIVIGGITYTVSQAIAKMQTSKRDRTYTMFQDLICAKLNVAIGNTGTCIASTITAADAWMSRHPVGSRVSGSSSAWAEGDPLHIILDDYNNGRLCAPHRG